MNQKRKDLLIQFIRTRELKGLLFLTPGGDGYDGWLHGNDGIAALPPFGRNQAHLISAQGEILSLSSITPHPTDPAQYPLLEQLDLSCLDGPGVLGVVNQSNMKKQLRDAFRARFPQLSFADVTWEIERLKAQKTDAEILMLRKSAKLYDRLFSAVPLALQEGRLEREVVVDVRHRLSQLGADDEDLSTCNQVWLTSAPQGAPSVPQPILYPGRRIASQDRVNLVLNGRGMDKMHCAMGRTYTMGLAMGETKEMWSLAVEAQRRAAEMLRPGNTLVEIQNTLNRELLIPYGLEPDNSAWIYGIGWGRYEAPRNTDQSREIPLTQGMVLAIGPKIRRPGQDAYCCMDPYLVTQSGGERLSALSQDLMELE